MMRILSSLSRSGTLRNVLASYNNGRGSVKL